MYSPTFASDFKIQHKFNIFQQIRNDVVKRNESWDIFIAQKRGAGKSAMALRMALLLDPHFSLNKVCFTVSDFVDTITTRQTPGTVVIFDDLGTQEGGSSRKWQKREAHDLADIMQLNRTDGIITIATSLELDRGEKRLRAGFGLLVDPGTKLSSAETHGHGLASRIIMRQKITDVFDGTTFWQYWRYAGGGRIVAIDISHPPAELWKAYRVKRDEFLAQVKHATKETEGVKPVGTTSNHSDRGAVRSDKEWGKTLHVQASRIQLIRASCKYLIKKGAVDSTKACSVKEFKEQLVTSYGFKKSSAQEILHKLYVNDVLRRSQTGNGRTGLVWVTDRGRSLADKLPVPLEQ